MDKQRKIGMIKEARGRLETNRMNELIKKKDVEGVKNLLDKLWREKEQNLETIEAGQNFLRKEVTENE